MTEPPLFPVCTDGSMETEPIACPRCSGTLSPQKTLTTFPHGAGSHVVELEVELEVFTCSACGEQLLDHTAETAKEDAVRRWLGSRG